MYVSCKVPQSHNYKVLYIIMFVSCLFTDTCSNSWSNKTPVQGYST